MNYFNNLIDEKTLPMITVTLKCFGKALLTLGWSLLQVVDPSIGPRAAAAIVRTLDFLKIINLESSDHNEGILKASNEINIDENKSIRDWDISSTTHAYQCMNTKR